MAVDLVENPNGKRRERRGFAAGIDHREARPRLREHERRHLRRSDRDVHPRAVRRRFAAELFSDGAGRAEKPLEPADVDRHQIAVVPLVARRELLRDRHERVHSIQRRERRDRRAFLIK